jgi:NAD dependent epimerase/dehydratase family enzyme
VALRTSIVMAPGRGGAFDLLLRLTRCGLGGPVAGGRQYMSWIHGRDFARAVDFLLTHEDLTGPVNLAATNPLPMRAFMAVLRSAAGVRIGLPATRWMAELGAFALRTDTELLLKSRRVVPGRLLDAGFTFAFPSWPDAARDLVTRTREPARA